MAAFCAAAPRMYCTSTDVTVNQPHGASPVDLDAAAKLPALEKGEPPAGSRQRLQELGPVGFARHLRERWGSEDTAMLDDHRGEG